MEIEVNFKSYGSLHEESVGRGEQITEVATRVPKSVKDPLNYLGSIKEYSYKDSDIHNIMKLCKQIYKWEGVVGSAIDALVELCVTKIKVQPTGDKKADIILKNYVRDINLGNNQTIPGIDELSRKIALEYLRSGNVFPYEYWHELEDDDGKKYNAPKFILILDPENIQLPDMSDRIGNQPIYYKKTHETSNIILKDGRTDKDALLLRRALKGTELKKIRDRTHFSPYGYELNPNVVSHIKRKAQDYEKWGIPYLSRAIQHVSDLQKLRKLDEATIEGLINLITIFKIGTDEKPASQARLRAFANLLSGPKATAWLVWAHDIEVEQIGPNDKILMMKDKFISKYEEIFMSFGIPPLLFGISKGGNKENIYNQVLVLMSRLQHIRDIVANYYERVFWKICKVNLNENIRPVVEWEDMSLNRDIIFKQFVVGLYDRGLLDPQEVIERAGYDFDSVVNKVKDFKDKNYKEELGIGLPPNLPYTGSDNKQSLPNDDKKTRTKENVNEEKEKVKEEASNAIRNLSKNYFGGPTLALSNFVNSFDGLIKRVSLFGEEGIASKMDLISRTLVGLYKNGYSGDKDDKLIFAICKLLDDI